MKGPFEETGGGRALGQGVFITSLSLSAFGHWGFPFLARGEGGRAGQVGYQAALWLPSPRRALVVLRMR